MAVDVSKIPNNNKFDPVRQAILDLQGEISSGVAGVASINNVSGAVTLTGLSPITISSSTSTSQITIGINQSLLSITESQISDLGNYLDLDDTGEQTIAGDIVISGDLTISGTTTFIDTTHLNIGDNIITLNADLPSTTAPTENAGIAIYRGSSATKTFLWNETSDKWTLGSETLVAGTFEGNLTGNVTGNVTGNASTASALATARNIAVDGAVTGNADFDGSGDITITTSVNHNHDDRYYTETESDNRFVNVDGDTMTDDLNFDSGSRVRLHSGAFADTNDRYEIFATGDVMFLQYYDDDIGNGTSLQKVVLSLDGTTSQREATLYGDLRLKSGNVASPTYDAVVLDIDKVNGHVDITNVRNGSFSGDLTATTNLIVGTTNVYDNLPDGITYSTTDNRLKIGVSKNVGGTTETAIQPILLANLLTEGYVPYVATGGAGSATVNSKVSDSWLKLTSDTLELGASDPVSHEIKYARFLWQSGQNDKISTVYGARDIIASIQYLGGSKTAKIEFTTGSGGGRIQFNDEYTFPATDGTSGQVLSTNGSGDLSWVAAGGPTTSNLQDVTDNGNSTDNSIIISNSVPLYFTNTGTGTYNKGVLYSNTTDGFLFEAPWETDATTTRVPFILTWRGGMGHGGIKLNGDTQLHTNDSGLGVDITSPSAKLHVGGTSIFDGLMTVNDGNNYARLGDLNSNSTMALELKDGLTPVQVEAYGSDMRFYTGGAGRMTILSSGNARMESFNRIEFNNSTQYIYSPDANDLRLGANDDIYLESSYIRFWSGATEYARIAVSSSGSWIDSDLNIGGTSAQGTYKLQVNGTAHTTGSMYVGNGASDMLFTTYSTVGGAYSGSFSWNGIQLGNNGTNYIIAGHSATGGALSFVVNNTTRYAHGVTATDGTLAMSINSNGRVGIGVTTPERLLHVNGEASFKDDVRIYTNATTNQGGITMYDPDGGGYLSIAVTDDEHASSWGWQFQSNFADDDTGTTYFRIGYNGADSYLDSGDFGIGTTTPSAKLHVYVNSANDDTFHIYNGSVRTHLMCSESTNGVIYMRNSSNSNTVRINTSGFTYFNGGNVGIGVVSPDAKLHIQGGNVISNVTDNWHSSSLGTDIIRGGSQVNAISNQVNALKIFPATNTGKSAGNYWGGISFMHLDPETYGSSYTGAHMWIGGRIVDTPAQERSAIVFATNNSTTAGSHPEERMCILPNGTVGIGTTAPPSISSGVPTLSINSPNTNNLSGGFIYQSNGVSKAYHYWENSYLVHQVQSGGHSFNNGGVVLMRVESNGNTKIYASDDSRLTVTDTGDSSNLTMRADANNSIYSNKSLNIYTENADHISFSTNGQSSEKMRITSGGNVGIDVTSPTAKFQVGADINSNATGVSLCAGSSVGNLIARTTTHHNWFPYTDGNNYYSADNHIFRNASHSTEWLKIESNGRVRVNPSNQGISDGALWVYYDMKLYNTLSFTDGSFNTQSAISGGGGELNLYSNGTSNLAVKIKSSGYVGVNQTNPQARLHVGGRIRIDNPSTTGGTNTDQAIYIEHPSLSGEYFTMGFKDTARSGEKMQHPSGAYANSSAFYIEAGSTEAGGICLDQDSVHVYGSSDGGATFRVIDKDADVVTFEMLQTSWNGVFRGDVIAYGSMSSISDKRIKENIEPYENVLDKLCSLGVYSYNKITLPEHKRDRKEIGVIAQEVETVFPELVNEEKVDKPQDANGLEQIKTVDYEHLTAILLQSIKELRNEVNELKARLDA